ncbi:hypothetical protein M9458_052297, partial [Cirrhinus mrigala]
SDESIQATAELPESSQATAELPKPSQVTAELPEPSQVTAGLPEPIQITAELPEPSQATADVPESDQVTADLPESSQASPDLSEPSQVIADFPESIMSEPCHVSADLSESCHVSADFSEPCHISSDLPESHHITAVCPESCHTTEDHLQSCHVLSAAPRCTRSQSLPWASVLSTPPWWAPAPSAPPWWAPVPPGVLLLRPLHPVCSALVGVCSTLEGSCSVHSVLVPCSAGLASVPKSSTSTWTWPSVPPPVPSLLHLPPGLESPLLKRRVMLQWLAGAPWLSTRGHSIPDYVRHSPQPPPSPMAMPATFSGDAAECNGFLFQVNLYIQMQPQRFPSESAIVTFFRFPPHCTATGTLTTSDQLFRLRQDSSSVNKYTVHFCTLAAASGWNEAALLIAYRQGLNPEIHAAMAFYDDAIGLESFYTMYHQSFPMTSCLPVTVPEPKQVDSTRLTRTERNRRLSSGLCLYCGNNGHFIRNCPVKPLRPVYWRIPLESSIYILRWDPCDVTRWNKQCYDQCLSNLPLLRSISVSLASTQVESPEPEVSPEIPAKYMVFQDVFSKQAATRLAPHQPWDCAIELPPGAQLPKGRIYPLSIPEHQAIPSVFQTFMNEMFWEFLHRFVVVYIDDILIYSWNLADHRQHVQQVLHKLREHSLYLKLEKFEFHQPVQFLGNVISTEGVQLDQATVQAIQEWPTPCTVKELQCFLGFSNFYCHFIQNYSMITAPLTSLLRAKRLNPRQARWAVFLTRFNFKITYRPDKDICNATLQEPALPECPEGEIYVPRSQRQNLLGTAHESLGSGHPGSTRTLSLLQARYWWPRMHRDINRYVQSCSVCAMSNTPCHLPAGKLVPLPIPQRPWSHIGVDFVTNHPNSEGNICILVTADRFSKSCKLIPLKGLPTALETAKHVFCNFGLPEEIVSDQAPQFISHVWKAFFKLLGISVNLSSGYHPQTNGQTERKIQELGRYLQSYCEEDQHSWSRFLLWA